MKPLSPTQQRVYDAISECQRIGGYTPTMKEIGKKMGISNFTVAVHIRNIIEKGKARRINPRHIELL